MAQLKGDPKGFAKLLLAIVLGTFMLMALPPALKTFAAVMRGLERSPDLPFDDKWVHRGIWAIFVGVCIGIIIRLARKT